MKKTVDAEQQWSLIITPKRRLLEIPFGEIWHYRDLLMLLVRRDFVALYKQTILGPLWFLIQPILTTLMFTLVFNKIAGLSTDGLPAILFYLAGITCWSYFAETMTKASETFTLNASMFGKVYFPRVIVPLSIVLSNLIKFGVQFGLFLVFLGYYMFQGNRAIAPNTVLLLLPLLVLLMGGLGLGFGMIISAMTTKYRDLRFLLTFAVQLFMYATPVIYPLSSLDQRYKWILQINPITPIIESFRYGFLGSGSFAPWQLAYSFGVMVAVLLLAMIVFNQVEKNFMDTV
ncbi:ABC-2 type transporter [Magnetococcus marinus MC-1]|uniref:Transport permease protein n=1 Tax=Magnetococcus marinus (strain ATCC BAA-1437 / JCM 17883 / MC-1) TaxID=156889 RepID=A0LAE0_MAGMM|nr:ABC transporter permease [Magnetococcus marinus]ABK44933.1 ABC-2 type transporter [Magnetococcus marinus MC-1]